ncbi:MAG: hypothetical protein KTR14_03700 [Vampirovibrio sp.]|nr:hypothetical protein [Vampirovibrio sp.]
MVGFQVQQGFQGVLTATIKAGVVFSMMLSILSVPAFADCSFYGTCPDGGAVVDDGYTAGLLGYQGANSAMNGVQYNGNMGLYQGLFGSDPSMMNILNTTPGLYGDPFAGAVFNNPFAANNGEMIQSIQETFR